MKITPLNEKARELGEPFAISKNGFIVKEGFKAFSLGFLSTHVYECGEAIQPLPKEYVVVVKTNSAGKVDAAPLNKTLGRKQILSAVKKPENDLAATFSLDAETNKFGGVMLVLSLLSRHVMVAYTAYTVVLSFGLVIAFLMSGMYYPNGGRSLPETTAVKKMIQRNYVLKKSGYDEKTKTVDKKTFKFFQDIKKEVERVK